MSPLLMGLDYVKQQECMNNTAKKTLQFEERGPVVILTKSSMSKSVVVQVKLMLGKSLQFPACSEMEVVIKAPGSVSGKTWIFETSNSRRLWPMLLFALMKGKSWFAS